jgi:pimeloyl-ACP methyl ester carboxylesterase
MRGRYAGDGKTKVILLHGVGLDRRMWQPVLRLLRPQFDVEALDLLGHGASQPAPAGVTLADLASDVARRLEPHTHLVGFSLGALVAQHLARFRPDLIASLTSVSSVWSRTGIERRSVLERLDVASSDFAASVDASMERWFASDVESYDYVRAETRKVLLSNDVPSYLNCYRVFATGDREIEPELRRITVPSLAITGELDLGSTPEMTLGLAKTIPDCTAVVVPDARHMLPVQKPGELAAAFTSFMKEKTASVLDASPLGVNTVRIMTQRPVHQATEKSYSSHIGGASPADGTEPNQARAAQRRARPCPSGHN